MVVVIAPKDNFTASLIAEGIEYREIEIKNYGTNPITDLKLILQLIKLYKQIKPDLVFHYTIKPNIYGSFAAAYCGVPSIIITTGLGHLFEFKNMIVRWVTLFLYRIACRLSKETWFLNTNDLDVFTYKRIVKKSKAKLLRGEGIDTNWFKPTVEKRFNGTTSYLFAGRILKDKGIQEFVEAAAIIRKSYRNVKFYVLGFIDESNPNSLPYRQIAEWQNLGYIKYLGETSDVRPYLSKASCLVFPSYYREGISRILMEAAAMETPIITTDNVGCREIVDHNINGFLCEPRSVPSLISYIEKFIEMEEGDKLTMGKLGRKKMIKEYGENLILDFYDKKIIEILGPNVQKEEIKISKSK